MNYNDLLNNSLFFNRKKENKKKLKLNIGAGTNIFITNADEWINYDRDTQDEYFSFLQSLADYSHEKNPPAGLWERVNNMPPHQKKIYDFLVNKGKINYVKHDIKDPFHQHQDNSVDFIYLGQMIEHLNPIYETPAFLSECYRMLKPGGLIRITTPDLELLIKAYIDNQMDIFNNEQPQFYRDADRSSKLAYIMYGACGPHCKWNNYEGHMFLFTKQSMTAYLTKAGFKEIQFFYNAEESKSEDVSKEVVDEGMSHSFAVEAIK